MIARVICRDARTESLDGRNTLVIVASHDEPESPRNVDLTDPAVLAQLNAKLASEGVVLGGPLVPHKPQACGVPQEPLHVSAQDDSGQPHCLTIDSFDKYDLSVGSALYYLYIAPPPANYHWLIGKTLELSEEKPETVPVRCGA